VADVKTRLLVAAMPDHVDSQSKPITQVANRRSPVDNCQHVGCPYIGNQLTDLEMMASDLTDCPADDILSASSAVGRGICGVGRRFAFLGPSWSIPV
jgi:hypothetical protein